MKKLITILLIILAFNSTAQLEPFTSDKQIHFIGSAMSCGWATAVSWGETRKVGKSILIGSGATIGLGIFKELVIDKAFNLGSPSWSDMIYNGMGVLTGAITIGGTIWITEKIKDHKKERQQQAMKL